MRLFLGPNISTHPIAFLDRILKGSIGQGLERIPYGDADLLGHFLVRSIKGREPARTRLGLTLGPDLGRFIRILIPGIDEIKSLSGSYSLAPLQLNLGRVGCVINVDPKGVFPRIGPAQVDMDLSTIIIVREFFFSRIIHKRYLMDIEGLGIEMQGIGGIEMRRKIDLGLAQKLFFLHIELHVQDGMNKVMMPWLGAMVYGPFLNFFAISFFRPSLFLGFRRRCLLVPFHFRSLHLFILPFFIAPLKKGTTL